MAALVPIARAALIDGTLSARSPAMLSGMLTAEAVLCPFTGLAAWLVWRRFDVGLERKRTALRRWGWLLLLSALWPVGLYAGVDGPAVGVLLVCLGVTGWTALAFRKLQPGAALLLLPYGAWFALMAVIVTARF